MDIFLKGQDDPRRGEVVLNRNESKEEALVKLGLPENKTELILTIGHFAVDVPTTDIARLADLDGVRVFGNTSV